MYYFGGSSTSSNLVLLILVNLFGESLNAVMIKPEDKITSEEPLRKFTYNSTSSRVDGKKPDDCIYLEKNFEDLNPNQFLTLLTKECRYDKFTTPKSATGEPLAVRLSLHIKHIELLDNELYKLNLLIRYSYTDDRLKFRHLSSKRELLKGRDLIQNRIWIPHIAVPNEMDAKVMGLEGKDVSVSITPEGEVAYSFRSLITPYCGMDFRKFPFDKQNCTLHFQSWLDSTEELLLFWDEDPVKVPKHLTGFQLKSFATNNSSMPDATIPSCLSGNCSTINFKFEVAREVGHYLLDYFIPSILIVCTSWITFWLQADAGPPRATLGTATLLSFITLATAQTKSLPKVSYIKISEIWFLGCVLFIFASLAEFAFVNLIFRRKKNCELKKVNGKYVFKCTMTPSSARNEFYKSMGSLNGDNPALENVTIKSANFDEPIMRGSQSSIAGSEAEINSYQPNWTTMTPPEVANWIDTRCRILFPIAFLIFNICFWSYTLSVSYI